MENFTSLGHFLLVRTYQNTSSFTVNILYGTTIHQAIVHFTLYVTYIHRINDMYTRASTHIYRLACVLVRLRDGTVSCLFKFTPHKGTKL